MAVLHWEKCSQGIMTTHTRSHTYQVQQIPQMLVLQHLLKPQARRFQWGFNKLIPIACIPTANREERIWPLQSPVTAAKPDSLPIKPMTLEHPRAFRWIAQVSLTQLEDGRSAQLSEDINLASSICIPDAREPKIPGWLSHSQTSWVCGYDNLKRQKQPQKSPSFSSVKFHWQPYPSAPQFKYRSTAIYASWFWGPQGISCWELALFVDLAIPRKSFTEGGSTPFSWRLHRNTREILTWGQPFSSIPHFPPHEGQGNYETPCTELENYSRAELCKVPCLGVQLWNQSFSCSDHLSLS